MASRTGLLPVDLSSVSSCQPGGSATENPSSLSRRSWPVGVDVGVVDGVADDVGGDELDVLVVPIFAMCSELPHALTADNARHVVLTTSHGTGRLMRGTVTRTAR